MAPLDQSHFGIISPVVSTVSRKPVFGYLGMVYAMIAIGFIGFIVWVHVVAHFHHVLSRAAVFSIFAGWYHGLPKMTGYMYSERIGQLHFWPTFIRVNLLFFPQHFLGPAGVPRRHGDYPDAFTDWNKLSSSGAYISGIATLIFVVGVIDAFWRKRRAADNPWGSGATMLAWTAPSPTPFHTFATLPKLADENRKLKDRQSLQ